VTMLTEGIPLRKLRQCVQINYNPSFAVLRFWFRLWLLCVLFPLNLLQHPQANHLFPKQCPGLGCRLPPYRVPGTYMMQCTGSRRHGDLVRQRRPVQEGEAEDLIQLFPRIGESVQGRPIGGQICPSSTNKCADHEIN
jgi:hypothetical protein